MFDLRIAKLTSFIAVAALVSISKTFAQVETACDTAYVAFDGAEYTVSPGAEDDGLNIQCAIDEASEFGASVVNLSEGEFKVTDGLLFTDFTGFLQGKTKTDTQVLIALETAKNGILVEAGRTTLRYMTIEISEAAESGSIVAISPLAGNCSKKVTRFEIDRVLMRVGAAVEQDLTGLVTDSSSCDADVKMQGTVLLNRVDIVDTQNAVELSMGGGARVDIYFSDITSRGYCFASYDANQTLNFVGNTCLSAKGLAVLGVAPAKSAAIISNNDFRSKLAPSGESTALSDGSEPISQVSQVAALAKKVDFTISGNSFHAENIIGTAVVPVTIKGEAAVFKNSFLGPITTRSQAALIADSHSTSKGSAIFGNAFDLTDPAESTEAFSDVFLVAGSNVVKQSDARVSNSTSNSLVSAVSVEGDFSSTPNDSPGIDSNNFGHGSNISIVSINGYLQPGSQISSQISNNTGATVVVRSLKFFADDTQIGTVDGADWLEDGLLLNGESFGLTVTINQAVSGVISSKFILEYESDVFVKSYVNYDPDRPFGF